MSRTNRGVLAGFALAAVVLLTGLAGCSAEPKPAPPPCGGQTTKLTPDSLKTIGSFWAQPNAHLKVDTHGTWGFDDIGDVHTDGGCKGEIQFFSPGGEVSVTLPPLGPDYARGGENYYGEWGRENDPETFHHKGPYFLPFDSGRGDYKPVTVNPATGAKLSDYIYSRTVGALPKGQSGWISLDSIQTEGKTGPLPTGLSVYQGTVYRTGPTTVTTKDQNTGQPKEVKVDVKVTTTRAGWVTVCIPLGTAKPTGDGATTDPTLAWKLHATVVMATKTKPSC